MHNITISLKFHNTFGNGFNTFVLPELPVFALSAANIDSGSRADSDWGKVFDNGSTSLDSFFLPVFVSMEDYKNRKPNHIKQS